MRIFLDANILFSAGNAKGPTVRVLRLLISRGHQAVTCDYALEEARKNVEAKRPAWVGNFASLTSNFEIASTHAFAIPVSLASKDVPILCSAIRATCRYLVTNDKQDFGHLFEQTVHGVTVISLLRLTQLLTDPTGPI